LLKDLLVNLGELPLMNYPAYDSIF
jgi:hypothetical protein